MEYIAKFLLHAQPDLKAAQTPLPILMLDSTATLAGHSNGHH